MQLWDGSGSCHASGYTIYLYQPVHILLKQCSSSGALESVSEMRDLGVIVDSKLNFGPHIDSVVGRANRALGMYLRSLSSRHAPGRKKFPPSPLIVGFNAHIRSVLEFGSVIWAGAAKTHIKRMD